MFYKLNIYYPSLEGKKDSPPKMMLPPKLKTTALQKYENDVNFSHISVNLDGVLVSNFAFSSIL